jgi:hypothetical protein
MLGTDAASSDVVEPLEGRRRQSLILLIQIPCRIGTELFDI